MEKISSTLLLIATFFVCVGMPGCGMDSGCPPGYGGPDCSVKLQSGLVQVDSVRVSFIPARDTSGAEWDYRGLPDVFFQIRSYSPGYSFFPFPIPLGDEPSEGDWFTSAIEENIDEHESRLWVTPELYLHTTSYDQLQLLDYDHDSSHDVMWTTLFDWDRDDPEIVPDSIQRTSADGIEFIFYIKQP